MQELSSSMNHPGELPIWARLEFVKMVPKTYFFDEMCTKPRKASDANIIGFARTEDLVEIYYEMDWPDEVNGTTTYQYVWPVIKP